MSDALNIRRTVARDFRTPGRWLRPLMVFLLLAEQGGAVRAAAVAAAGASVPEARIQGVTYEDNTLRIRLDKSVTYRIFSLSKPPRLVVELPQTIHSADPYEATVEDGLLKRIRSAQFQSAPDKIARVVLDVAQIPSYEAVKDGSDILIRFTAAPAAAVAADRLASVPATASAPAASARPPATGPAPAHKSAAPPAVSGQDRVQVTATAAEPAPAAATRTKRSKDLLAALPRNPVTIDFEDADIRDVVRVLAEMSEVNIIHSNDLRGIVTIHLDQVPFNEAFHTILTMQGLVAQQMGDNILRVLTPEALSADRSRSVTTYKTFTLNYAQASEVQQHLGSVRISPNAMVTVDQRTNSLIVTDTPEGLAAAERLISELDKKPQQVMIEARMVEVSLNDSLDLGIQWEYANKKTRGTKTEIVGQRDVEIGGTNVAAGEAGFVQGAGVESALSAGSRGTGVSLPGPTQAAITFGFINNTDLLTATLGALATRGQTKVLSSPKVITINNRSAKIQSGSRIPFSITTVAATGVATQSFQFVDVGIILTVTPTINADNRIRLNVKPEVSFPGNVTAAGPEINTRNAETEVIIRDGETIVIGGLIDEQMRESANKVPLLGDIPVLGVFFRNTSDSKRRSELLVFVTPRIVRE
jgi:type IV pilus assembly protein PilQ